MQYTVAIIGALEAAGRELLKRLEEDGVPARRVQVLEGETTHMGKVSYGDNEEIPIKSIHQETFAQCQVVVFLGSQGLVEKYAAKAMARGVVCIDATGYSASKEGASTSIHKEAIQKLLPKKSIVLPAPITLLPSKVIEVINEKYALEGVSLNLFCGASLGGNAAMDEIFRQTRGIYMNEAASKYTKVFSKQIAFNIIPEVGDRRKDGQTDEEVQIYNTIERTHGIKASITALWVPVFVGTGLTLHANSKIAMNKETLEAHIRSTRNKNNMVLSPQETITPAEVSNEDGIFISRLRILGEDKKQLALFATADVQGQMAQMVHKTLKIIDACWA